MLNLVSASAGGDFHDFLTPDFQQTTGEVATPAGVIAELSEPMQDVTGLESTPASSGDGDNDDIVVRKLAAAPL
jgi:hypothetical protein